MDKNAPLQMLRMYYPLIFERDVHELATGLGFEAVHVERDLHVFAMPIEFPWRAMCEGRVIRWDNDKAWFEVRFYVTHVDFPTFPIGTTWLTDSVKALRRYGVTVMQGLFACVDDPTVYLCPGCGEGLLGWNGVVPRTGRKAQARCTHCDWEGRPERFEPLKELT